MPQRRRPKSNRGSRLFREWRLKEGKYASRRGPKYTQREVAIRMTVDSTHVSNWENGRLRPDASNRVKLKELASVPFTAWDEEVEQEPARAAG